MKTQRVEKLVSIHFSEGDRSGGKLLYEAIVEKCREIGIAGATVLRGSQGYGAGTLLQRAYQFSLSPNGPLTVQVIDMAAKIDQLLVEVEPMVNKGLIIVSDVEVIRYTKA